MKQEFTAPELEIIELEAGSDFLTGSQGDNLTMFEE